MRLLSLFICFLIKSGQRTVCPPPPNPMGTLPPPPQPYPLSLPSGGYLFVILVCFMMFGFFSMFFYSEILQLVYAIIGVLIFSLFLVSVTMTTIDMVPFHVTVVTVYSHQAMVTAVIIMLTSLYYFFFFSISFFFCAVGLRPI